MGVLLILTDSCKKDKPVSPAATTESATLVTNTTATLNGSANANNTSTTLTFEYGLTTSYGQTSAAVQSPLSGTTSTSVSADITGLASGLIYHYRLNASSTVGTTYGDDSQFTTTITDIDANVYSFVTISTQVWMVENLKTTKYRNGDLIETTTPDTLNISAEGPSKYQWAYKSNVSNVATYGRLYTWYAVTDSRNVCPDGWHLPTDAEWTTLITYLGGDMPAGGKLKEIAISHWQTPNTGATNETGFTALPGGYRDISGPFHDIGNYGFWWSATEFTATAAWYRGMLYNGSNAYREHALALSGFSVRCLRD